MLRSLVGSEMCIRDRYKKQYNCNKYTSNDPTEPIHQCNDSDGKPANISSAAAHHDTEPRRLDRPQPNVTTTQYAPLLHADDIRRSNGSPSPHRDEQYVPHGCGPDNTTNGLPTQSIPLSNTMDVQHYPKYAVVDRPHTNTVYISQSPNEHTGRARTLQHG